MTDPIPFSARRVKTIDMPSPKLGDFS